MFNPQSDAIISPARRAVFQTAEHFASLYRRALTLATLSAPTLFIASAFVSVNYTNDNWRNTPETLVWRGTVFSGTVMFEQLAQRPQPGLAASASRFSITGRSPAARMFRLPQYSPNSTSSPWTPTRTLSLPPWLPFLLTALPATLMWRSAYRRHRRTLTNSCPRCAYPLTGLPPATPCPECGTAAPPIAPPPPRPPNPTIKSPRPSGPACG